MSTIDGIEPTYKAVNAHALQKAWTRYRELFGDDPHGTTAQLSALLSLLDKGHKHANNFPVLGSTWQNLRSGRLVKVVDFSERDVKVRFVSGHTRRYFAVDFPLFFRPESEILHGRR